MKNHWMLFLIFLLLPVLMMSCHNSDGGNKLLDPPPAEDPTLIGDEVGFPTSQTLNLYENSLRMGIAVRRTGDLQGEASIGYRLGGRAVLNTDYTTPDPARVVFPAGRSVGTIALIPINDSLVEGKESIVITLNDPQNCHLGANATKTVFLFDPYVPPSTPTPTPTATPTPAL